MKIENTNGARYTQGRVAAAIILLLFIGSAVFLILEVNRNGNLKGNLNDEKLKAETYLSEKLSLEKELASLRSRMKSLEGQNAELDRVLEVRSGELDDMANELRRAQQQGASIASLKKQNQELQKLRDELQRQVAELAPSLKSLQEDNASMASQLLALQNENRKLNQELEATRLAFINDALVEPTKRNSRLTVNARKTRKLTVVLDVPAGINDPKFTVIDPNGSVISDADKFITVKTLNNNIKRSQAFYASTGNSVYVQTYKRVELVYAPKSKLKAGVYKIEVTDGGVSIGSLRWKLK